jgi:hypothetical protein
MSTKSAIMAIDCQIRPQTPVKVLAVNKRPKASARIPIHGIHNSALCGKLPEGPVFVSAREVRSRIQGSDGAFSPIAAVPVALNKEP